MVPDADKIDKPLSLPDLPGKDTTTNTKKSALKSKDTKDNDNQMPLLTKRDKEPMDTKILKSKGSDKVLREYINIVSKSI